MKYVPRYDKAFPYKRLHPLVPRRSDSTSYIYFLLKNHKVVYVGQTQSIRLRIHSHSPRDFDSIRWIKCRKSKLDYYEKRWIRRFSPKYNVMYTDRWQLRGKKVIERTL